MRGVGALFGHLCYTHSAVCENKFTVFHVTFQDKHTPLALLSLSQKIRRLKKILNPSFQQPIVENPHSALF